MWLINSSIGRKVVMSVTGVALILFLTFHASMNVVALFSARGYNMICEFLGANWYAVVATVALAVLVALHFIYAIWLTLQNRNARGSNRYDVTQKPEKVEWASQNMLVLGIIVVLGLCLHLLNFWHNMMFAELAGIEKEIAPSDGTAYIVQTFASPVYGPIYTILYIVWLAALWLHLNHGMWSSMQTLGWNGKVWFCRWRVISTIYTSIIILMFAAVALAYCFGYTPKDYETRNLAEKCPTEMAPAHHGKHACKVSGKHACKASEKQMCNTQDCCDLGENCPNECCRSGEPCPPDCPMCGGCGECESGNCPMKK